MVMAGKAMMMSTEVIKVDQEKIGKRIIDMPGARRLRMVTMKLKAPAIEATPRIWRPRAQKSISLPEKMAWVSGAYPYQPWSGTSVAKGKCASSQGWKPFRKDSPSKLFSAPATIRAKMPGSENSVGR